MWYGLAGQTLSIAMARLGPAKKKRFLDLPDRVQPDRSPRLGCGLGLIQIPRCAYNVSTMRRQRPRRFHTEPAETPVTRIHMPSDASRTTHRLWSRLRRISLLRLLQIHTACSSPLNDAMVLHTLAPQNRRVRCMFEIVVRVQIGNEPRLNRSPSQPFLRQRAGSRSVYTKEETDPSKMIGCFLAGLADDR